MQQYTTIFTRVVVTLDFLGYQTSHSQNNFFFLKLHNILYYKRINPPTLRERKSDFSNIKLFLIVSNFAPVEAIQLQKFVFKTEDKKLNL